MNDDKLDHEDLTTAQGLRIRDLSVNHADASIDNNGKIVLATGAAIPQHHEFNGGSNAWKAIAGIRDYNNVRLEDFSLTYTFSGSAALNYVYFNLVVSAEVINGEPVDENAPKDPLLIAVDISNGGGVENQLTFDPNNFMIVGYRRKGSSGGWYGQSFSLSDLSPKAKLTDKKSSDNGMPKNTKLNGILLILGDTTTEIEMDATIESIEISPRK